MLRREAIGYCAQCKQSPAGPCSGYKGSWQTADEYDELSWQLEAGAGDAGNPRRDEPELEEYEPPEVPDTAQAVAPEVACVIGGYARAVNCPASGPDGEPRVSPKEAVPFEARGRRGPSASDAEWLAEGQADPGPTERQLENWNIHNDRADRLETRGPGP